MPYKNNKSKQITVRCPYELLSKLEAKRGDNRTLSEVIIEILEKNIDQPLDPEPEELTIRLTKRLDQLEVEVFDAIAELREEVGWVASCEELEQLSEVVKNKLHLGEQAAILKLIRLIAKEKGK